MPEIPARAGEGDLVHSVPVQHPKGSVSRIPLIAGLTVAVIACLVFVGWFQDSAMLKSMGTGWVSMKPNTAAALLLCGLALAVCGLPRPSKAASVFVVAASFVAMLIGAVSLSQYLCG